MPARAYCTAMSESDTPMKGPKRVVRPVNLMPVRSFRAARSCGSWPSRAIQTKNPTMPVRERIIVDAKGMAQLNASGAFAGSAAS